MQNLHIAMIAAYAARLTTINNFTDPDLGPLNADHELAAVQLHDYCRARKFPPAEQLARKAAELNNEVFAPGIWQASETLRGCYEVFRAVAQALEPFWEPDQEGDENEPAAADDAALAQIKATLAEATPTETPKPKGKGKGGSK